MARTVQKTRRSKSKVKIKALNDPMAKGAKTTVRSPGLVVGDTTKMIEPTVRVATTEDKDWINRQLKSKTLRSELQLSPLYNAHNDKKTIFVLRDIGFLRCGFEGTSLKIYQLYINVQQRRKGYGRRLVNTAIRLLKEGSVFERVYLLSTNSKNHKFYQKIGFVKAGTLKNWDYWGGKRRDITGFSKKC